jgi:hypothetical protein
MLKKVRSLRNETTGASVHLRLFFGLFMWYVTGKKKETTHLISRPRKYKTAKYETRPNPNRPIKPKPAPPQAAPPQAKKKQKNKKAKK